MMSPSALLDSNVVIAAVAEAHEHHTSSLQLFETSSTGDYAVAAHSYAEAFSALTRRGAHAPFRWPADETWAALESVAVVTQLVGLSPAQSFDAVRLFAAASGIGARLYDYLIGQAAVVVGIPAIVTWNTGHLKSLFPSLAVETPTAWLARNSP